MTITAPPRTERIIPPKGPFNGFMVLTEVLQAIDTWVRIHEYEATERAAIAARREIALAEIDAKRELFMTYLNRSFDEREEAFARLFEVVDHCIAERSDLTQVLTAITVLASKNPFADLHDIDLVTERLSDPTHEWLV